MSTWLAFDAGSPVTSAAVARDGIALGASSGESRSGPSLLHHLAGALAHSGVEPSDLDGILALRGPGSFTGIRVTLATAIGLRGALEVPVWALSNLAALALSALPPGDEPTAGGRILALVDALRDEWFAQEFQYRAGELGALSEPIRIAGTAIAPAPGVVLAAHAAQVLPEHLAQAPVRRAAALSAAVASAGSAARLGGLLSSALEPLYLRAFTMRGAPP